MNNGQSNLRIKGMVQKEVFNYDTWKILGEYNRINIVTIITKMKTPFQVNLCIIIHTYYYYYYNHYHHYSGISSLALWLI